MGFQSVCLYFIKLSDCFSPAAARPGPASNSLQPQHIQHLSAAAAAGPAPAAAAAIKAAAPAASATAPSAVAVPTARPARPGTASCQWGPHPIHNTDTERRQAVGSH